MDSFFLSLVVKKKYDNKVFIIIFVFSDHPRCKNWTLDFSPRFYFPLSPRSLFHTRQRFLLPKHVTSGFGPLPVPVMWFPVTSGSGHFLLHPNEAPSKRGHYIKTRQSGPYGPPLLLTMNQVYQGMFLLWISLRIFFFAFYRESRWKTKSQIEHPYGNNQHFSTSNKTIKFDVNTSIYIVVTTL